MRDVRKVPSSDQGDISGWFYPQVSKYYEVRVLWYTPKGLLGRLISWATQEPWSHVAVEDASRGIIIDVPFRGPAYLAQSREHRAERPPAVEFVYGLSPDCVNLMKWSVGWQLDFNHILTQYRIHGTEGTAMTCARWSAQKLMEVGLLQLSDVRGIFTPGQLMETLLNVRRPDSLAFGEGPLEGRIVQRCVDRVLGNPLR